MPKEYRVATLFVIAIVTGAVIQGCGFTYCPILLEAPNSEVRYVCTTRTRGGRFATTYATTIAERKGGKQRFLSLDGKAESMAVSPDGKMLAVAVSLDVENDDGIAYRVFLIETANLTIYKQLPIVAAKPGPERHPDYAPSIQRFDCMALSDDSRLLAAYYWKPSPRGGHESVVTLWDTESENFIRELHLPEPDESLWGTIHGENVSGMAFSADDALLALSGAWSIKDPHAIQPDGFIRVWGVSDGQDIATFRPKRSEFWWNLCLDNTGSYLAGSSWTGQGTRVSVWSLPDGQEVASHVVDGRIRPITRGDSEGTFHIWTVQGKRLILNQYGDITDM